MLQKSRAALLTSNFIVLKRTGQNGSYVCAVVSHSCVAVEFKSLSLSIPNKQLVVPGSPQPMQPCHHAAAWLLPLTIGDQQDIITAVL